MAAPRRILPWRVPINDVRVEMSGFRNGEDTLCQSLRYVYSHTVVAHRLPSCCRKTLLVRELGLLVLAKDTVPYLGAEMYVEWQANARMGARVRLRACVSVILSVCRCVE